MIPFDFIYCRAYTLMEAHSAFTRLHKEGENTFYYGGGSEIITMSRVESIKPYAVLDIKNIPECNKLYLDDEFLHLGSACSLHSIKESKLFPLLTLSCGRIADHTNQCRITLGGNLCGTIIYRETSLPLLLSDASITILGAKGLMTVPFSSVFDGRMRLNTGELVVEILIPLWALAAPHFHVKRTTNEKIDYPLVSMAAILKENSWRFAFSGVCGYPFRCVEMETVLNDEKLPIPERVNKAAALLQEKAVSDAEGSAAYRLFVFKNMLQELLTKCRAYSNKN